MIAVGIEPKFRRYPKANSNAIAAWAKIPAPAPPEGIEDLGRRRLASLLRREFKKVVAG
jgi:hypothetical protein